MMKPMMNWRMTISPLSNMKLFSLTRCENLLIAICLTRRDIGIRTYPDFGLGVTGFFNGGMSVFVRRAAGSPSHGEAGQGCQDPGLAKLNYSVLVARGQVIFICAKSRLLRFIGIRLELCPFPIRGSQISWNAGK